MKTLYQQIIKASSSPFWSWNNKNQFIGDLKSAEIVLVDNIAELFWEDEKLEWDIEKDFPNLAPPFDSIYMEYLFPKQVFTTEGFSIPSQENTLFSGLRIGALLQAKKTNSQQSDDVQWWLGITLAASIHHKILVYPGEAQYLLGITADGTLAINKENSMAEFRILPSTNKEYSLSRLEWIFTQAYPMLLAISFLHCKNVSLIENTPILQSKKRNRHNRLMVKHYVLHIEPMKKVLSSEGNSETSGLKKALHICRGHFKDFRKGNGLFGKLKEIYWWESQVRGNAENGIVVKEYNVKKPKN